MWKLSFILVERCSLRISKASKISGMEAKSVGSSKAKSNKNQTSCQNAGPGISEGSFILGK